MSAIIIDLTSESEALIATDTLVVDTAGHSLGFTSKAFHIPHMNLVVAGTGIAGMTTAWLRCINEELSPLGIEGLNAEAPKQLKRLFEAELARWSSGHELYTTTIYHVGVSEVDGRIKGFHLHSSYDFEPRQLSAGVLCKPPAPEGYADDLEPTMRLVELMNQQRAAQAAIPHDDGRLYIGGDIQLLQISKHGCVAMKIHQFRD